MMTPTELDDILEKVRIGGWYDAIPEVRETDNCLDTDVAKKRIVKIFQSILEEYKEGNRKPGQPMLGREGVRILNELHERFGKV